MRARLAALAAALVLAASGCDLQTAGSPTGDLDLLLEVDDSQDLVRGHTVQISNVVVGSVRAVELDGYRSRVTISIVDGHRIPRATEAVIRRTSLLGEHFVDLRLPPGGETEGPFLDDGDTIPEASAEPDFEDLAGQAAQIVGAVAVEDIADVIDAGAVGIGGRGEQLNRIIEQFASVSRTLGQQREELVAAIDALGSLGRTLAPASDDVAGLIDDVAEATTVLAAHRERFVEALESLTALAQTTNEVVLEPHTQRLTDLLADLEPVLDQVLANRSLVEQTLADLLRFAELIPRSTSNGRLQQYVWLVVPGFDS